MQAIHEEVFFLQKFSNLFVPNIIIKTNNWRKTSKNTSPKANILK